MNHDYVIDAAKDCGLVEFTTESGLVILDGSTCMKSNLIRFVQLVEQATLERAAKVCEDRSKEIEKTALSHEEDSPSRDRCMARAREVFYLSQDIRAMKWE